MKVNEKIYLLRKEHNLSQEELANELNVSRQTVSKWETGESSPDIDKIVPLCEYFGITADELLTGNKNIVEAKAADVRSNFARNIAVAVGLYIASLVVIIICSAEFNEPIIGVSIFFTLIAVATGLLIYNGIYYKKESTEKKSTKQITLIKQITGIVDIIGLIVYLIVSFLTHAWHITWIIFIIFGLINMIIKLIFNLKNDSYEEEE